MKNRLSQKHLAIVLASFAPIASAINVSTKQLSFGNQNIFTTSYHKTVTLTNSSSKSWERINGFKISSDDFKRVSSNCPGSLAPKQSCFWNLAFSPGDSGAKNATVAIWASMGSATVTLSGYGVTPPPEKVGPKKWHPGHYAQFPRNPKSTQIAEIAAMPEMSGALIQYDWGVLERSKGVFDFSPIERDLAILKSKGKRLAILVNDKSFNPKWGLRCVPADMAYNPAYRGGQYLNRDSQGNVAGCIAKRWVPEVMDRFIAFHKVLGKRFDADPYVEAVTNEESAVGQAHMVDGATMRDYVDQLKRLASGLAAAYPHTLAEIWLNWGIAPYTLELVDHLYRNGIGMGGPDTAPVHPTHIIPEFTSRFAGKMPILTAVQPTWLTWKANPIGDGELSLNDVFKYAVTGTVGANATHLYWWYFKKRHDDRVAYDFYDTVALIRRNGGRINGECPESLICDTR